MSLNQSHQSPLDPHRELIEHLVDQQVSFKEIARQVTEKTKVPTSDKSVRRALKRWDKDPQVNTGRERPARPGIEVSGDTATVTSKPASSTPEIADLLAEYNESLDDWEVDRLKINRWEGAPTSGDQKNGSEDNRTYRQITVHLIRKKKIELIQQAQVTEYKRPKYTGSKLLRDGDLVVFAGDQQAPFHDQGLHEKFCQWLYTNKPQRGVLIGDTVDFPDISRHRDDPENNVTVQECINSAFYLLRDYVEASPGTQWTKLCGNHDERIRNTLIDNNAKLYNVKRAEIEGHEEAAALSISHLLRLDQLGIEYIDPQGQYDQAQVQVSPYLAARHGWLASKGAGSSALRTLEHLGYSIIVGHTHRQSLVHKTTHDIGGKPTTLAGVETGCMCRIEEGLGYAVAPDWQNGFATAHVWSDGKFKIDLATFVSEQLLWRDQRYG